MAGGGQGEKVGWGKRTRKERSEALYSADLSKYWGRTSSDLAEHIQRRSLHPYPVRGGL